MINTELRCVSLNLSIEAMDAPEAVRKTINTMATIMEIGANRGAAAEQFCRVINGMEKLPAIDLFGSTFSQDDTVFQKIPLGYAEVCAADDWARIRIGGLITSWNFDVEDVIQKIGAAPKIYLWLEDCIGGSADIAQRLYNVLVERETTVDVSGACLSAGTVLLLSGKHRRIARNAYVGVHSGNITAFGNAEFLRTSAASLDEWNAEKINLFSSRTGQPAATVEQWFSGKTFYFNSTDAVKMGLAHEIAVESSVTVPADDKTCPNEIFARDMLTRLRAMFADDRKFREILAATLKATTAPQIT